MLTVITGTPGAGKTLYAIQKIILGVLGKTVTQTDKDGVVTQHDVKVYTNIKGLQVDHELIDDSDKGGIKNWHEWAKPGSLIVYDEFQKVMPPRPNGSAVPRFIQELDEHRHRGVDFVLITQNVINVDRHVHGLTGRHIHIRRMGYMPFCIVYEWDHCSRQLLFSKAISQGTWRYDKKIFKLYHSADAHTKQPRKLPVLIWFILLGFVGAPVLGYQVYQSHLEKLKPQGVLKAAAGTSTFSVASMRPASAPVDPFLASRAGTSTVAVSPHSSLAVRPLVVAGCAVVRDRCECFTVDGVKSDPDLALCQSLAVTTAPVVVSPLEAVAELRTPDNAAVYALQGHTDGSILRWMQQRRP